MTTTFKISELCGIQCLQHTQVEGLEEALEKSEGELVFSFAQVEAISPTFANELFIRFKQYKIEHPGGTIKLVDLTQRQRLVLETSQKVA